jgi:ketosteroid isomerase-like protein
VSGQLYVRRRISLGPTRSRRSLDQQLRAHAPALSRAIASRVLSRSPRSRLRQALQAQAARSGFDAYNRRDWEVVLSLYDPQVEIRLHHVEGIEGVHHGHEGWRHYWRLWFEAMEESHMEPEEIVDFQDRTLFLGWTRTRAAGSGLEMKQPTAWLLTYRAGAVVLHEEWWDQAMALEAVGLPEQDVHAER